MRNIRLLRMSTVPHSLHLLLRGQLKYMGDKGIEVSAACNYEPEIEEVIQRENIKYYDLPLSRKLSPLLDLIALFKTILLFKRLRPDIVHTHSPKAGIVGMLAAKLCNVPLRIHTVAGLPLLETKGLKRKILDFVERWTYSSSNWVLPNSIELEKIIIVNKLIKDPLKLRIIGKGSSNGINLDFFNQNKISEDLRKNMLEKFQLSSDHIILTFVGRLTNYKGINELVTAFVTLQCKYDNLILLLVGPFEDLNPLTDETMKAIEDNSGIISVGHQDDVRPYLAISSIFVFPSYREGFPQSLMQACAMGLPCIASNINGCNEMITDKETGLLIEPKSVKAIVDACSELIAKPESRMEMGKGARDFISRYFSQEEIWHELYLFYLTHLESRVHR